MKLKLASIVLIGAFVSACGGETTESTLETTATAEVSELKTKALEACGAQLEQVPEEMREQATVICECTVENMDYAKLEALTNAGESQEAMKLSMEVAQKCSESP